MPSPSCHGATHPFTSNIDNKRKVVKKLRARLSLPILAGPSLQLPNSITTTPEPAAAVASREVVVVPPPSLSRRCINKPIKAKAKPHCLLPLPCFSLVVRPRPPLQACAFRLVAVVIVEMDGGVGVGAAEGGGGGGVEAAVAAGRRAVRPPRPGDELRAAVPPARAPRPPVLLRRRQAHQGPRPRRKRFKASSF
jgi:hypothetical protein